MIETLRRLFPRPGRSIDDLRDAIDLAQARLAALESLRRASSERLGELRRQNRELAAALRSETVRAREADLLRAIARPRTPPLAMPPPASTEPAQVHAPRVR